MQKAKSRIKERVIEMTEIHGVTNAKLVFLEKIREKLEVVKRLTADTSLLLQNPSSAPSRKHCKNLGLSFALDETGYENILSATTTGKVEGLDRLASSKIAIYGLSGTSFNLAETLARAGIGCLVLFGQGQISTQDQLNLSIPTFYRKWQSSLAAIDHLKNVSPDVAIESCDVSVLTSKGVAMIQHVLENGTCIETETSGTNIAKVDGATEKEKISCYFCNGKQTNPIAQFESTPRTVIKRILSAPPMNKSTKGTNRIDLLIVNTENLNEILLLHDMCLRWNVKVIFLTCKNTKAQITTVIPQHTPCLRCDETHQLMELPRGPSIVFPSVQLVASGIVCARAFEFILDKELQNISESLQIISFDSRVGLINKDFLSGRNPDCVSNECRRRAL
jgi:hypothetical protein